MTPPPPTDAQLLQRIATDSGAFDEFYRRYEPIVVAFLRQRVGDPEAAADMTADTFIAALGAAPRFTDNGQPAVGWLLGIAHNVMRHRRRRFGTEQRAFRRLALERPDYSAASLDAVDALLDLRAGASPLVAALAELPADQRDAVQAYILDERPYREIAAALGVKEGTLRQRVRRGLDSLRRSTDEAST